MYRIIPLTFLLVFTFSSTFAQTPDADGIIYVKSGATGAGDSWAHATGSLQAAIDAVGVEEVWVAAGIYKPTSGTNRAISFVMKNNVKIYGGFPGSGDPDFADRNWTIHETILSGDIGTPDNNTDNSYHVIHNKNPNLDHTAILDGFTITGGNADGDNPHYFGGGINNTNSSPTLVNLVIIGNRADAYGGGIYNWQSFPTLTNITVNENTAGNSGGGIYNHYSSPTLVNVSIIGNTAGSYGGGMKNTFSSSTLTNVKIIGNTANRGGGIYDEGSSPILNNVLVSGNSGVGIWNHSGNGIFTNTTIVGNSPVDVHARGWTFCYNAIVWGKVDGINFIAYNSLIQGNTSTNNGNIDASGFTAMDIFTDSTSGDFSLNPGSPAINTGDNGHFTGLDGSTVDLVGNPRLLGGTIDLGAYEFFTESGIRLTKSVTSTREYGAGDIITYEIVVTNMGANALTDVLVVDDGVVPSINGSFEVGNLGVNEADTIIGHHTVSLDEYCSGSYTNVATVSGQFEERVVTDMAEITTVFSSANNTIDEGEDLTTCIHADMEAILLATTGATGAEVTGLPAGVTGNWANNEVTISGTPEESGDFEYTVSLTGECGIISTSGTITVLPFNTIDEGEDRTTCINTAITDIVLATTGATGATFSGLPTGVTGTWTADVVTISGTPEEFGDFEYTVTLTGGCGDLSTTGVITVIPQSDLAIEKSVDNPNPAPGAIVTFSLTARNVGGVDATQVTVEDQTPSGYTYQSDNGSGAYDPISGIWTIGELDVDESASLDITVSVNPSGEYLNEATISSYECDPDVANNSVSFQSVLGSVPNCGTISPAIGPDGQAQVSGTDFVTNNAGYPLTVTLYNRWGGVVAGWPYIFDSPSATHTWEVCNYLGQNLEFSVSNHLGTCNQGQMRISGQTGLTLTSALQPNPENPAIGTGLLYVYCGNVPSPEEYRPTTTAACGGGATTPRAQPDWIMPITCSEESDTAEIIFRTWESFDKEGNLTTLTDTIVVFRLPRLTPDAFVGEAEETLHCELIPVITNGAAIKNYKSWKQPVGLHDYELPQAKLRGITYEIPASIIIEGLEQALFHGVDVFLEYLNCVILKRADGTSVTIGDLVSGDYARELIAIASSEQRQFGLLQILIGLNEDPLVFSGEEEYTFYPYLLLQEGDWVLSEGGNFEQVNTDWFYSGNGQNPFWFSAGWPFIFKGGSCVSFCDAGQVDDFGNIEIRVPGLSVEAGGFTADCHAIALPEGMHCGITVEVEDQSGWTQSDVGGSCQQMRGVNHRVVQTCWARTPNPCLQEEGYLECEDQLTYFDPQPNDLVVGYECSDKSITIHLSQWQTLVDDMGPIFDYCYPIKYRLSTLSNGSSEVLREEVLDRIGQELYNILEVAESEEIFERIQEYLENDPEIDDAEFYDLLFRLIGTPDLIESFIGSEQSELISQFYGRLDPTTFRVGSHDCAAEVFVPDVQVIDNCSGIHSVKAMVEVQGGTRSVELTPNGVEHRLMENGDTCFVYTYSHVANPIRIPFSGCAGELTEVRYEAADNCRNLSAWYKYLKVIDDTPPTAVTNREVNVSLQDNYAWVRAVNLDEGSWDSDCYRTAIDLMLGRRSDWLDCVTICENITKTYTSWNAILADLGLRPEDTDPDFDFLRTLLSDDEVEDNFYNQIVWLWEEGYNCGKKVVHAWLYDLTTFIGENCTAVDEHGNTLPLNNLERLVDELFDQAGYGAELALLGGGWANEVPVKCEDACESVTGELLVMDNCGNWSTQWTDIRVEDHSNAHLVQRLPDLEISCEAYNGLYKDIVESAVSYGQDGSGVDSLRAFVALDSAFGKYVVTWVDNRDIATDINGNPLSDSVLHFDYWNVSCAEKSDSVEVAVFGHDSVMTWKTIVSNITVPDTTSLIGSNGIIGVNCAGTITQNVWMDLDECGEGTITRRFFITSGCGEHTEPLEVRQIIEVRSACGMRESMFDLPANVGTVAAPICLPQDLSENILPSAIGAMTVKDHLLGQLCNSFAVGPTVEELNVVGLEDTKKYRITWTAIDWCAPQTSKNREFNYTQEVIAVIDPGCDEVSQTVGRKSHDVTGMVHRKTDRREFILYQNYPNPYEGYTVIGFSLPAKMQARLTVYDMNGRALKIVEGLYDRGYNEVELHDGNLPVGVLYYQLDTERYSATKKMVIVRR